MKHPGETSDTKAGTKTVTKAGTKSSTKSSTKTGTKPGTEARSKIVQVGNARYVQPVQSQTTQQALVT